MSERASEQSTDDCIVHLYIYICKASTSVPTAAGMIKIILLHNESDVFVSIYPSFSLSHCLSSVPLTSFESRNVRVWYPPCYTRKNSRVDNPLVHRSNGSADRNEIFSFFLLFFMVHKDNNYYVQVIYLVILTITNSYQYYKIDSEQNIKL